jgi:hypothetical protein
MDLEILNPATEENMDHSKDARAKHIIEGTVEIFPTTLYLKVAATIRDGEYLVYQQPPPPHQPFLTVN